LKSIASFALVSLFVAASTAGARADGWSFSSLNPFAAKKDDPAPAKKPSANSSAGPSIPQLDHKPLHPAQAAEQPSMLSKIGSTPSNMWAKTKHAFSPAPKPAPSGPALGTQNKKPAAPSSSGGSWNPFASKQPEPKQPRTASDFIGLPRPTP